MPQVRFVTAVILPISHIVGLTSWELSAREDPASALVRLDGFVHDDVSRQGGDLPSGRQSVDQRIKSLGSRQWALSDVHLRSEVVGMLGRLALIAEDVWKCVLKKWKKFVCGIDTFLDRFDHVIQVSWIHDIEVIFLEESVVATASRIIHTKAVRIPQRLGPGKQLSLVNQHLFRAHRNPCSFQVQSCKTHIFDGDVESSRDLSVVIGEPCAKVSVSLAYIDQLRSEVQLIYPRNRVHILQGVESQGCLRQPWECGFELLSQCAREIEGEVSGGGQAVGPP